LVHPPFWPAMTSGSVRWPAGWSVPPRSTSSWGRGGPRRSSHAVRPIAPRGVAVLPPRALLEPWFRLPDVFRHFVALVRVVTGCVEFAARAPGLLQPSGDSRHRFLFGEMSPHMLTKWPPLASRTAQFLSTQNARMSSTSGMSNARRWPGASLTGADPGCDQANDE
jgi:hypothetical protein